MNTSAHSRDSLEKLTKQELIALLLAQPSDTESTRIASSQDGLPRGDDDTRQDDPSIRGKDTTGEVVPFLDQTALYRQVAENFPNGALAVLDQNARYQFITGKEVEKIGKTPGDFIGSPIGEVLPISPKTKKKLYTAFQAALLGKDRELEVTFKTTTYRINIIPLTTTKGEIVQVLALIQNITDQKKILTEVQHRSAQLESLIESVDDAIWSVDRENRLMLANSAFYRAIRLLYKVQVQPGQKLHEQIGAKKFVLPFQSTANPESLLEEWRQYQQRALKGEKFTAEIHYPFKFQDVCLRVSFNPVYDTRKRVIGVTFFAHDVTDLRQALRHAQEQEQQFKVLAENIPGVVYIAAKKPARHCVYINDQVEQLTGYPAKDFLEGRISLHHLIHPNDHAGVRREYRQARRQQRPYCFVYRLKHRQGQYRWMEEHGTIFGDDAHIFQGVILDVSVKRQYEEQLEQQNQHLRKVNAELDHFAYSVSHDLRAPLTSAMGLLMLLQQEESPQQQREYVAIINRNLRKLDAFIQDIILLSKNVRTDLEANEIHFETLLSDVLESQRYNPDFELVHLTTHVTQPEPFYSDRRRLKIILNNLISNAVKYSFSRRSQPFARVTITVSDGQALIHISDNGIGIQEEHLPHIFDMFYRATDRKSGSGLGLYLVKETLEKLGGSVAVESVYGEGTTFTVQVPSLQKQ